MRTHEEVLNGYADALRRAMVDASPEVADALALNTARITCSSLAGAAGDAAAGALRRAEATLSRAYTKSQESVNAPDSAGSGKTA